MLDPRRELGELEESEPDEFGEEELGVDADAWDEEDLEGLRWSVCSHESGRKRRRDSRLVARNGSLSLIKPAKRCSKGTTRACLEPEGCSGSPGAVRGSGRRSGRTGTAGD
jgi:hypothetical protein